MLDTSQLTEAVTQVGALSLTAAPFVKIAVDLVKLWHIRQGEDLFYPRALAYALSVVILYLLLVLAGNSAVSLLTVAAALLGALLSLGAAILTTETHKAARNREPGT